MDLVGAVGDLQETGLGVQHRQRGVLRQAGAPENLDGVVDDRFDGLRDQHLCGGDVVAGGLRSLAELRRTAAR